MTILDRSMCNGCACLAIGPYINGEKKLKAIYGQVRNIKKFPSLGDCIIEITIPAEFYKAAVNMLDDEQAVIVPATELDMPEQPFGPIERAIELPDEVKSTGIFYGPIEDNSDGGHGAVLVDPEGLDGNITQKELDAEAPANDPELIKDKETKPKHSPWASLSPVAQAALLCKNPNFWAFINVKNEDQAAVKVRDRCGVESRAHLTEDVAHKLWARLDGEFRAHMIGEKYGDIAGAS